MVARGKSTIDLEVNTGPINSLVELAERYKKILEETNELLKENARLVKGSATEQERVNRTAADGARRRKSERDTEKREEEAALKGIFEFGAAPKVGIDPVTKKFTKLDRPHPTWSQPKPSEESGRFAAGWEKSPPKGSLSDLDRLRWGPSRDRTGSGQFRSTWERPGGANPLPMPGLKYTDPTGRQYTTNVDPKAGYESFKKTFEKFDKSNENWNKTFYQMFTSGRLGQSFIKGLFSGNFIKMLGIGGTAGAALYAVEQGAQVGAQMRLQAGGLGTTSGGMRAAQIDLARFGPVDPGLQAMMEARSDPNSRARQGLRFLGFSLEEIEKTAPETLLAQAMRRTSTWGKSLKPEDRANEARLAENAGITAIFGGQFQTVQRLTNFQQEEVDQAAKQLEMDRKLLDVDDESLRKLTDLNAALGRAGLAIQTNLVDALAKLAPAGTYLINKGFNEGDPSLPNLLNMKKRERGIVGDWLYDRFGLDLNAPVGANPFTKPDDQTLHSPKNNPPLESSIYGSAAIGESEDNRGVTGGITRVGIFTPKISALNKEVESGTRSFTEFNELLMRSSNILIDLNQDLKEHKKWWDSIATQPAGYYDAGPGGTTSQFAGTIAAPAGIAARGTGGATGGAGVGGAGDGLTRGTGGGVVGGAHPGASLPVAKGGTGDGKTVGGGISAADVPGLDFGKLATGEDRMKYSRGVQNFNPVNIAAGDWAKAHGATGSAGMDVGHGVAVFPDYATGLKAARDLALAKYAKGQHTLTDIVAQTWPGSGAGTQRTKEIAANIAKTMGVSPDADLNLNKKENMEKFLRALTIQEVGPEGANYIFGGSGGKTVSGVIPGSTATMSGGTIANPSGTGGSELGKFRGLRADDPADRAKIDAYMKEAGIPQSSENIAWCAAWVNAQLAHEGIKGTGALSVDSFRRWGRAENPSEAKIGDIMITKSGSHVGRFEGMDPKTGKAKFYAGNEEIPGGPFNPHGIGIHHGYGMVNEREVDPNQFIFRGAPEPDVKPANVSMYKRKRTDDSDQTASRDTPSRLAYAGTPHLGDMSQFQTNQGVRLHINNPAGMDVVAQTAMLGSGQGNFG